MIGRFNNCKPINVTHHITMVSLPIEWEPPNVWQPTWVEAGGTGSEGIHLRQNKGKRCLLNTKQGSHKQDSKSETICNETVREDCI